MLVDDTITIERLIIMLVDDTITVEGVINGQLCWLTFPLL